MYHYIRFRLSPPNPDALTIRKAVSDALSQTFGLSVESTYVDVLSIAKSGQECVLRVRSEEAPLLITSLVTWKGNRCFSLVKESPFLPSLLADRFR